MAQASRLSKAKIYKKKGTKPMIARMAEDLSNEDMSKNEMSGGMHKMLNGMMMGDKEMKKMMK